jgi:hypothetical protein
MLVIGGCGQLITLGLALGGGNSLVRAAVPGDLIAYIILYCLGYALITDMVKIYVFKLLRGTCHTTTKSLARNGFGRMLHVLFHSDDLHSAPADPTSSTEQHRPVGRSASNVVIPRDRVVSRQSQVVRQRPTRLTTWASHEGFGHFAAGRSGVQKPAVEI